MDRILKKIANKQYQQCQMCTNYSPGGQWRYKSYDYVSEHISKELIVCRKCVYREVYGTRDYKKAMKQNLLEKLDYDFSNTTPRIQK